MLRVIHATAASRSALIQWSPSTLHLKPFILRTNQTQAGSEKTIKTPDQVQAVEEKALEDSSIKFSTLSKYTEQLQDDATASIAGIVANRSKRIQKAKDEHVDESILTDQAKFLSNLEKLREKFTKKERRQKKRQEFLDSYASIPKPKQMYILPLPKLKKANPGSEPEVETSKAVKLSLNHADPEMLKALFEDAQINKFINMIMWDGKKETARKIVLHALLKIKHNYVAQLTNDTNRALDKHMEVRKIESKENIDEEITSLSIEKRKWIPYYTIWRLAPRYSYVFHGSEASKGTEANLEQAGQEESLAEMAAREEEIGTEDMQLLQKQLFERLGSLVEKLKLKNGEELHQTCNRLLNNAYSSSSAKQTDVSDIESFIGHLNAFLSKAEEKISETSTDKEQKGRIQKLALQLSKELKRLMLNTLHSKLLLSAPNSGEMIKPKLTFEKDQLTALRHSVPENPTPVDILKRALDNAKPILETRSVSISGQKHQVPYPLPPQRRDYLGNKWIITAARNRKAKKIADALYEEIMDAYNNRGSAIKKRIELHKVAEANRAYAHLRSQVKRKFSRSDAARYFP